MQISTKTILLAALALASGPAAAQELDAVTFATNWLAIMPSDIVRRPKGVVGVCVCIFLHLSLGKRNLLAESALKPT